MEDKAQETQQRTENANKSRPVTVYLAGMFLVAFLLLLVSFLSQERSHQAILDLNQQVTASQDAAQLQLEKQQLEFRVSSLEESLEEARQATKAARADLENQVSDLENQVKAMEWLRQIEGACRRSYDEARTMVEQFHASGLESSLPEKSLVEGQPSPAATYREIYAHLF